MARSRKRIRAGCQSESRAVIPEKNRLLAGELQQLLNGREGVLRYLDNCGSIIGMRRKRDSNRFLPARIPSTDDLVWTAANRGIAIVAARGLYRRLHPSGQLADEDILTIVSWWSFQVLDGAVVQANDDEVLSLVPTGPRKSFVDLLEVMEKVFNPVAPDPAEPTPQTVRQAALTSAQAVESTPCPLPNLSLPFIQLPPTIIIVPAAFWGRTATRFVSMNRTDFD